MGAGRRLSPHEETRRASRYATQHRSSRRLPALQDVRSPVSIGSSAIVSSTMRLRHFVSRTASRRGLSKIHRNWTRKAPELAETFRGFTSHEGLLRALRMCSFVYLSAVTLEILTQTGKQRLPDSALALNNDFFDAIPHPLDLAVRARVGAYGPPPTNPTGKHHAGYAEIRGGTFRSKYPTMFSESVFDEIFVVTNEKCPQQVKEFMKCASENRLSATQWPVEPYKHVSLARPPIPVSPNLEADEMRGNKVVKSILRRQIAYLDAHRRIWLEIKQRKLQRTLVLDDSVFPNYRLLRILPSLFNQVDQESLAMQKSWHIVNFRRKRARSSNETMPEPVWSANPRYNHAVVRTYPSYGAGMYAISLEGASWLLEHIGMYRAPLDVEFALLQRQYPDDFVALSACNNDEMRDFCPEIVEDIGTPGVKHNFECVWRRIQERRLVAEQRTSKKL